MALEIRFLFGRDGRVLCLEDKCYPPSVGRNPLGRTPPGGEKCKRVQVPAEALVSARRESSVRAGMGDWPSSGARSKTLAADQVETRPYTPVKKDQIDSRMRGQAGCPRRWGAILLRVGYTFKQRGTGRFLSLQLSFAGLEVLAGGTRSNRVKL